MINLDLNKIEDIEIDSEKESIFISLKPETLIQVNYYDHNNDVVKTVEKIIR